MNYKNQNRQVGLSGIMRVCNEELLLAASIDSCVNQLDELIIVYNDCTDRSAEIIEEKESQYPDKIKVYPYPYHLMGIYSTREEYEYVKSLPEDSVHLLSTYNNFALEKVNYQYVVKIDADQIYFDDKLAFISKSLKTTKPNLLHLKIGNWCAKLTHIGNKGIFGKLKSCIRPYALKYLGEYYLEYGISRLKAGNCYLMLSGIDSFYYKNRWVSPISCIKNQNEIWNPYNGEGDTFVFKATDSMCFKTQDYGVVHGSWCFLERFVCPSLEYIPMGFYWSHLRPQKEPFRTLLTKQADHDSRCVVNSEDLGRFSFDQISERAKLADWRAQLFGFCTAMDKRRIRQIPQFLSKFFPTI